MKQFTVAELQAFMTIQLELADLSHRKVLMDGRSTRRIPPDVVTPAMVHAIVRRHITSFGERTSFLEQTALDNIVLNGERFRAWAMRCGYDFDHAP